MYTKYGFAALAAAASLNEVAGAVHHRHNHPKRAIEWAATEVVVETDWVTVTTTLGQTGPAEPTTTGSAPTENAPAPAPTSTTSTTTSSSAIQSSSTFNEVDIPPAPTTTAQPQPTTMSTRTKPTSTVAPTSTEEAEEVPPAPSTTNIEIPTLLPEPSTTETPTSTSTPVPTQTSTPSGGKRGAAYNDPALVESLMQSSASISWAYNWASDNAGLSTDIPYYAMLWSPDHYDEFWGDKVRYTVNELGSDAVLSFNECDISSQCNKSPADAAQAHIDYMNPYGDIARISTPAISSSQEANQGLDWLSQWFDSCAGQCVFDFCAVHWYGPGGDEGAELFLDHLQQASDVCGKPLWVTEFAAEGSDSDIDTFMSKVTAEMDSLDYVEKYAYFMVAEGELLASTSSLTSYGQIYAGMSTTSF